MYLALQTPSKQNPNFVINAIIANHNIYALTLILIVNHLNALAMLKKLCLHNTQGSTCLLMGPYPYLNPLKAKL